MQPGHAHLLGARVSPTLSVAVCLSPRPLSKFCLSLSLCVSSSRFQSHGLRTQIPVRQPCKRGPNPSAHESRGRGNEALGPRPGPHLPQAWPAPSASAHGQHRSPRNARNAAAAAAAERKSANLKELVLPSRSCRTCPPPSHRPGQARA
jgi:hypothetical protein